MAVRCAYSYHGGMTVDASARLLVGARGYTHRNWWPQLYPDELPAEWRFIFYSHRHPAILMPARAWAYKPEQLSFWQEEAPPNFRMVLEIPGDGLERLMLAGPLPQPLIAGCIVRVSRLTKGHRVQLAVLAHTMPVAVDFRIHTPGCADGLSTMGVGVCGRPAQGLSPVGPFAVSLVGKADRPLLGKAVQELLRVPAANGRALFFYEPQTAIKWVAEAQLLVNLLAGSL